MTIPQKNKDIVDSRKTIFIQEKEIPMPRKPRMYLPGIPSHVVQRGNDRNPCFFEDDNCLLFLDFLLIV
jgi:hypothetical protein